MLTAVNGTGDMAVRRLPAFQINQNVLVLYPDPTDGAGGTTTWSWDIRDVVTDAIKASGGPLPQSTNAVKVELTDAAFEINKQYKVRLYNAGLSLRDEWFFTCVSTDFDTVGPINTADINEAIVRIAGLLGLNSVVSVDYHDMGISQEITITIYDRDPREAGAVVLHTYTQRKVLDASHRVIGEISAARS